MLKYMYNIGVTLIICGCSPEVKPVGSLQFLRGGLLVTAGDAPGRALPDGRVFVERPWTAGETVELGGLSAVAPRMAECEPLFHTALGDVSRLVSMGGEAPDTSLAWSPDGARLAIGGYTGELVVVDGWTGQEIARRTLAETMVKMLTWSADSQTLYAGEQSPDANLWALDPATLSERWRVRLADEVQSSAPPAGEDLYGVYSLPAAYGIHVLPGGDLLVAAAHGWNQADGTRRNQSRLIRFSALGQRLAAWPEETADATIFDPRLDASSTLAIAPVNRSATGPAPAGLPVGGAAVIRLSDMTLVTGVTPPPLAPYYKTAFLWEALDVDPATDTALLGLGDGRVLLYGLDGVLKRTLEPGTPILVGEVPISASVGFGALAGDSAVFITSNTNIPYGAAAPDLRPPSAHPGENTLWVYGLDGALRWTWRGEQRLNGLRLGPDGRTLVVGAGPRVADLRHDLYGALIFDLGGPERSGEERLSASCATSSPIFFRTALSADGRLAVTEVPSRGPDGGVLGDYRVTVFR